MHRVFAFHSIAGIRNQRFERRRVMDRNCIAGTCLWKPLRRTASDSNRVVRSRWVYNAKLHRFS